MKYPRKFFIECLIHLAGWIACASCILISAPEQAQALIGGVPTSNPFEIYFGTCTGTMIAPNVILTAGHCVYGKLQDGTLGLLRKKGEEIEIHSFDGSDSARGFIRIFKPHVYATAAHTLWINAIQTAPYQDADLAADVESVADVGVIVLDQSLPLQNVALPSAARLESARYSQTELILLGAGCQVRGDNSTNGTLKTSVHPILKFTNYKVLLGTAERLTHQPAGICKRDSGGGVFVLDPDGSPRSTPMQIAVNSVMEGSEKDATGPAPVNFFVSRIDRPDVLTWLAQFVLKAPGRSNGMAAEVAR